MSKLLSALAQSDAQRASATVSSRPAYRTGTAPKQTNPWLLPGLGFALPVIGILGYLSLSSEQTDVKPAPVRQVVAATASMPKAAQPAAIPASVPETVLLPVAEAVSITQIYPQEIELLGYPQLYTEPLPSNTRGPQRARYNQMPSSSLPVEQAANEPSGWDSEPIPVGREVERSVNDSWDLEALDYSELSPELASQLRSAIAATGDGGTLPQLLQEERLPSMPKPQEPMAAVSIGALPASVQDRIPALNFQTHIYSSVPNSRWVKVNGSEAYEGDEIAPGVILRRIDPREVVFDFESYLISMPALSEW
ncbi:general secretion pathway protein GspB [Photobacterium sp. DNB23_23_1]|uniref:General secretion pathway protein GspB n=1 Tax=Photobacterium pectinilyticum TaxID=2906793 RepID=A0ABT1N3C3_9GAMM|nr:general secretion pathway protein GspB [Photobacterium sp. ZSDE20]MCQ1059042.1 general secretion pathway protein GspB [Photobacterium sp. ZSDE20]MDD1824108.1 general secretion pathway protein GspB [Photobacterium sp. ZSDE20]